MLRAQGVSRCCRAQGNVFVLVGPAGNTDRPGRPEGALVVDAQPAALSASVLDAIGR